MATMFVPASGAANHMGLKAIPSQICTHLFMASKFDECVGAHILYP